jgi:hypothetical protein
MCIEKLEGGVDGGEAEGEGEVGRLEGEERDGMREWEVEERLMEPGGVEERTLMRT